MATPHPRTLAILQALLVTFLWSTSWVLIKLGLEDLPPLTFAGLRYGLAALVLLPFAVRGGLRRQLRGLTGTRWLLLVALGLLFYTVTQGAQFVGLRYLPAVTVNLVLALQPLLVGMLGAVVLAERLRPRQWAGILLAAAGAWLYFGPAPPPEGAAGPLSVVVVGAVGGAVAAVIGRGLNREGMLSPLTITCVSMGLGAAALLAAGLSVETPPHLGLSAWAIVGWLAVVNTAFAFTLWNHTLKTLTAAQSSVLNNTMVVQIAVLAWAFLGERFSVAQGVGLGLVGVGAAVVQLERGRRLGRCPEPPDGEAKG